MEVTPNSELNLHIILIDGGTAREDTIILKRNYSGVVPRPIRILRPINKLAGMISQILAIFALQAFQ